MKHETKNKKKKEMKSMPKFFTAFMHSPMQRIAKVATVSANDKRARRAMIIAAESTEKLFQFFFK